MEKLNLFEEKTAAEKKQLASYACLHFINDLHATTLPNVLPILRSSLSLSLAQLGILNAAFGIMHFIGQPVAGFIADRQKKPWFAVWGPMLSVFALFMLPSSLNFGFALMFCFLLGLGTALFHPQGNGRTGRIALGSNMAFYLAFFTASGSFGSAFGPLLFVFWYSLLGKNLLPVVCIPFFIILFCIWKFLSAFPFETAQKGEGNFSRFFSDIKIVLSKIYDLFAIVTLRDIVFQGVKVFLPMLIIMRGGTNASAAVITFAVVISVAFANLAGGRLASAIGEQKLLFATLALTPVVGILGIMLNNFAGVIMLMLLFALLEASAPATISMAQRRCPDQMSTAASLASGATWGLANLAAYPVGSIADSIGLEPTLYAIVVLPWIVTAIHFAKIKGK